MKIKNETVVHWKSIKGGDILGSLGVDLTKFVKKENNLFYFETKKDGTVYVDQEMLERIIERYQDLKLDLSILIEAKKLTKKKY